MKTTNHIVILIAAAILAASSAAYSQPTNGNFSSGLSGWTAYGDAAAVAGGALITTAASAASTNDDDPPAAAGEFNYSGSDPDSDPTNSLAPALGLAAGGLDPDAGNGIFAQEGSALSQSFTVAAGEVIVFDWRLYTNDNAVQRNPDYAFVIINGSRFTLGTSADAGNASSFTSGLGNTTFALETGLSTYTSTALAAGTVNLAFAIVDSDGFDTTSALFIDNVSVIPEPSTVALIAFGMAGAVILRRRRTA